MEGTLTMSSKNHSIGADHETVRRWRRERFITTSARKKRPHRNIYWKDVQSKGSHHEGRGAECYYVCVHDAKGKVHLRFGRTENTVDSMPTIWENVECNGIPRSIYLDRFSSYYGKEKLTESKSFKKNIRI